MSNEQQIESILLDLESMSDAQDPADQRKGDVNVIVRGPKNQEVFVSNGMVSARIPTNMQVSVSREIFEVLCTSSGIEFEAKE